MSMREDEILEKLRQDVQIPERVQQKAEEAFASIKKGCPEKARRGEYGNEKSNR